MPHQATDRISRGLRWAGAALLVAGGMLVIAGIGLTQSADALITISTIAALAFGVPGAGAFGMALWFEHVADRLERETDAAALEPAAGAAPRNPFREPLGRYAVALVAVGGAWGLRALLDTVAPGQVAFLPFFLAVIVAGWFGSFGPAALATLASLAITWIFYIQATLFAGAPDVGRFVVLGLFVVVCLGIAAITAALHAALARTQRLALELESLRAERRGMEGGIPRS